MQRTKLTWPPSDREPTDLTSDELLELVREQRAEVLGEGGDTVRLVRFAFDARRRVRAWKLDVEVGGSDELDVLQRVGALPAADAGPPVLGDGDEGAGLDSGVQAVSPDGQESVDPAGAALEGSSAATPTGRRMVVVGSGPAGLFCALELARAGVRVTVLERGFDVQRRRRDLARLHRGEAVDPDSNYCHGEGGAGTYSDGKLYARSGRNEDIQRVLRELVDHGAPSAILQSWRPHIGSNILPKVVTAMRETLIGLGGEVRFGARATELVVEERPSETPVRRVVGVRFVQRSSADDERDGPVSEQELACDGVVVATGHSALDALLMLDAAGAPLVPKGFAMGLRIEHPQGWLDDLQYGGLRKTCKLPAAFFELVTERKSRGVYSFCMCPGGFMVPASTAPDRMVINGMSLSRRDSPFANSGVVVAVQPEDLAGGKGMRWGAAKLLRAAADGGAELLPEGKLGRLAEGWLPDAPDPWAGLAIQRALEFQAARWAGGDNRGPAQRADHFAAGDGQVSEPLATSYQAGLVGVDLARELPRGLSERLRAGVRHFDGQLPGFAGPDGQLVGVESRTSSPVRVERDARTLASPGVAGLYPAGEGAGYAGGIVSAALDGRRVAAAVLAQLVG